MLRFFTDWRNRRIVRKSRIPAEKWHSVIRCLHILDRLARDERDRLRTLAILFMNEKSFTGANGMEVTEEMKMVISLQACLPILNLDLTWYEGWLSIIVYPQGFVPERIYTDENGVVHSDKSALSGEAWQRGPVILSWQGVAHAGDLDGSNLVIHEFAHKLDMLNGVANGFPPLHNDMSRSSWTTEFSDAYSDFTNRDSGKNPAIDRYAASSPAEFFAVCSEVFFERPDVLFTTYPGVYQNLRKFYRQDPLGDSIGL